MFPVQVRFCTKYNIDFMYKFAKTHNLLPYVTLYSPLVKEKQLIT